MTQKIPRIKNALEATGLVLSMLAMGLLSIRGRARVIAMVVVLTLIAIAVGSQAMEKFDLGFWY